MRDPLCLFGPPASSLRIFPVFAAHMGWIDRDVGMLPGRHHALQADRALDDCDPWGHIALGYCATMEELTRRIDRGLRRAVMLNPSSAAAHSHVGQQIASDA